MGDSMNRQYTLEFTQEDGGRFSARVPECPGTFSYGDTLPEAIENIAEALALYVEIESEMVEAKHKELLAA
ncbi:type II toxin-antitoxin system HicB family antitoxin [bacterium]|nr:MAG: type II toxin-antitoxin system HicB family antitoxin [bacterium]